MGPRGFAVIVWAESRKYAETSRSSDTQVLEIKVVEFGDLPTDSKSANVRGARSSTGVHAPLGIFIAKQRLHPYRTAPVSLWAVLAAESP